MSDEKFHHNSLQDTNVEFRSHVPSASSDEKFRHNSLQDRESIGKYLNALSDGFLNGKLYFSWKDKQLLLEPQSLIKFDLETKKKDGEVTMILRLRWEESFEDSMFTNSPLVIGTEDNRG